MINLIILAAIIIVSILTFNDKYGEMRFVPFMSLFTSSALLVIHLISWLTVPISFDSFNARHNQLIIDLSSSREKSDPYERMAILQEITEHNQVIAENKQFNKNWFMDQYIDDRVESLETIK